jgi:hypothetical protein
MNNIIKTNSRGKILFDTPQKMYCVEFGNFELTLNETQFEAFKASVALLDYNQSDNALFALTLMSNKITLRLNHEELLLLRDLLGFKSPNAGMVRIKVNISMN